MEVILPYLKNYEVWIYSFLGLIALVYLQKLIFAWKDWQGTVYGLEREIAQRRFSTALTILFLLVAFVLLEFFTVSFVSPSYPQSFSLPTATLDLLATPTVTLGSQVESVAGETTLQSSTAAATPEAEGCTPGKIAWTDPKPGQEISETVELKGTVNVPNLGFYKYQYSKLQEEVWTDIAAGNQAKFDGQIGFWNTSQLVPGDYLLRLVVMDNQNQPFPACVIPVRVIQP